jgi:hypothetical protein
MTSRRFLGARSPMGYHLTGERSSIDSILCIGGWIHQPCWADIGVGCKNKGRRVLAERIFSMRRENSKFGENCGSAQKSKFGCNLRGFATPSDSEVIVFQGIDAFVFTLVSLHINLCLNLIVQINLTISGRVLCRQLPRVPFVISCLVSPLSSAASRDTINRHD